MARSLGIQTVGDIFVKGVELALGHQFTVHLLGQIPVRALEAHCGIRHGLGPVLADEGLGDELLEHR